MAVGGVFHGEAGSGLVGQLQRNEYTRYQRYISRRLGKGSAHRHRLVVRTYEFKAVADLRGELLPGDPAVSTTTLAMTEDNEMTLSLKTLGAKMVSPMQCRVTTELMPGVESTMAAADALAARRTGEHGAYRAFAGDAAILAEQIGIGFGTIALNAYLLLLLITLLSADGFQLVWFGGHGAILVVKRVVTVWPAGWRGPLLALPLVIGSVTTSLRQSTPNESGKSWSGRVSWWHCVPREATPAATHPVSMLAGIRFRPQSCTPTGSRHSPRSRGQYPDLRGSQPRQAHSPQARLA